MGRKLLRCICAVLFFASVQTVPQAANGAEHFVRIVSDYENLRMTFEPKSLEIEPGDRVIWINGADEEHNVITFPDGYPRGANAFQSPTMTRAGESFSHRFEVAGTYEYHCVPHLPMGMQGVVIVGRASADDEFHEPSEAEVTAYQNLMLEWFDGDDVEILKREGRARPANLDLADSICKATDPAILNR